MAEARLLKQEFDLELSDKKIAEQINALLVKESSEISRENEQLLGSLIEKWMDDEKKQKRLIRKIRSLQGKKKIRF